MREFLYQRWFLLALLMLLTAGMAWPAAMLPLARWLPGHAIVGLVMFVMALPLETGVLWNAMRRPGPAWLGVALNSGLAPPLGWLASRALPEELALGVIVAAVVPSTLATAAVWTRRAGGNDAVALLVTMVTNLACFLVVPAWLRLLTGVNAELDYRNLVIALMLLVVLPILAAQVLRQWQLVGARATRHKHALSGAAQIGVLAMVFLGAVNAGNELHSLDGEAIISTGHVLMMIAAVTSVHGVLLVGGFLAGRALRLAAADTTAVAFSGSQKTLMVGAYLALAIGPLAILPMVAYHAVQLVIDTLVADWLRKR